MTINIMCKWSRIIIRATERAGAFRHHSHQEKKPIIIISLNRNCLTYLFCLRNNNESSFDRNLMIRNSRRFSGLCATRAHTRCQGLWSKWITNKFKNRLFFKNISLRIESKTILCLKCQTTVMIVITRLIRRIKILKTRSPCFFSTLIQLCELYGMLAFSLRLFIRAYRYQCA